MDNEMEENSISNSTHETESNDEPKTVCERCPPHNHIRKKVSKKQAMQLWKQFLIKKKSPPTLEHQFNAFATMMDSRRDGYSINLFRSDYWFKQAKILDFKTVTLLDTSSTFNNFIKPKSTVVENTKKSARKSKKEAPTEDATPPNELTYEQWLEYVNELCGKKGLDVALTKEMLQKCGAPNKEAWVDVKTIAASSVTSIISVDPAKCKCICERPSAEADPYIHILRPELVIHQDS